MEIILLSSIVVTLFVVFGIATYREVSKISKEGYLPTNTKETGGRASLVNFMGNLFDEGSIKKEEKKIIFKALNRTISDMESDGVYFSDEVKDELKRQREELNCEYSGLPSVKFYEMEEK
jgi:hypothetical protein